MHQYMKYVIYVSKSCLPGHAIGLMHLPPDKTCPSGQKQPSAHPLRQLLLPILSQVCGHRGPHCRYTIPVGHSGAIQMVKNYLCICMCTYLRTYNYST